MSPTTSPTHCLLHLALPQALEDGLLDALLALPGPSPVLEVFRAESLGPDVPLPTALEQVRGRSQRRIVQLLLPLADVAPLLQALDQTGVTAGLRWWTTAVLDFGSHE